MQHSYQSINQVPWEFSEPGIRKRPKTRRDRTVRGWGGAVREAGKGGILRAEEPAEQSTSVHIPTYWCGKVGRLRITSYLFQYSLHDIHIPTSI